VAALVLATVLSACRPGVYSVSLPNGAATTALTVVDESGLVRGAAPTDLGALGPDGQGLGNARVGLDRVDNSNDLVVVWLTGPCYLTQRITVSGGAAAIHVRVDQGPTAQPACDAIGVIERVRLAMSFPVEPGVAEISE
jgi:hypothetical protein